MHACVRAYVTLSAAADGMLIRPTSSQSSKRSFRSGQVGLIHEKLSRCDPDRSYELNSMSSN